MISVTILTKNSSTTLKATLDSLKKFPEIVIYDTGSTDDTLAIAQTFPNVKIYSGPFLGFGLTHNRASNLATHNWILSIDSDEVLSPALSEEILSISLDSTHVYSIKRHNFFNNKHIRGCSGWYPDPVLRLYDKNATTFSEDAVHEKIFSNHLTITPLASPLFHTPYRSIDDFLHKMQLYSSLFASQHLGKKKGSLLKALLHGYSAFFKSYILKKGFLLGKEGFVISLYNAHTSFYKYLKLIPWN
ncbi:MAG: hypothetical protein RLZZ453_85 [Chlamydiota bacterium]|jgi:glycosyltransferase involved in cell wall biosynthesis